MKERDLAEKRRVAPGWLDSDAKLLQPERTTASPKAVESKQLPVSLMDAPEAMASSSFQKPEDDAVGQQLDRAFGGMSMNRPG